MGIEPLPVSKQDTAFVDGGAGSGTPAIQNFELAELATSWVCLPEHIRIAVMALVRSAEQRRQHDQQVADLDPECEHAKEAGKSSSTYKQAERS